MRRQALHQQLPLVALLLLAVYGCAGVLGYGLHSLWGCGHCHDGVCHQSADSSSFDGFLAHENHHSPSYLCSNSQSEQEDQTQLVLAEEDCPICAFLVQAQSQFVFQVTSDCVDVIPTIPPALFASYNSPLLGTHPGRGPPAC
ncbi:hypothetical protein [Bythopirellula polymerisocia]|uniref:Uncharacterized protein n=1 Tax=Bythopirellula polymerisocia TaxID=2528003 RepID=A0A5C6CQY1_9BACT|nr:hypothetical protein [Bythopirellula polymerisocia]TWU25947.1 hypothetical protein Pla144_31610 [Bythopirellula polymerisocia]